MKKNEETSKKKASKRAVSRQKAHTINDYSKARGSGPAGFL